MFTAANVCGRATSPPATTLITFFNCIWKICLQERYFIQSATILHMEHICKKKFQYNKQIKPIEGLWNLYSSDALEHL